MASTHNARFRKRLSTGTLGKRAVRKIMEDLTCTICLDIFSDPRILPCRHSFCLECLQVMAPGNTPRIKCPNCNATSTLPGPVSHLQPDFKANSLLAHMKKPGEESQPPEQQQQQQQRQQQSPTVPTQPAFKVCSGSAQADITCPVCDNVFQDQPRQLVCGHTFCTRCLEFMQPVRPPLVISCPCCDNKTSVVNGVKNLPVHAEKHTKALLHRMKPEARRFELNSPDLASSDEDDVDVHPPGQGVAPAGPLRGADEDSDEECCCTLQ